ncbi:MFS domain-containing protein [Fusarium falciforme]|uniref:MFS domain-containing protein n=1 Tax=Fusarium falciforme TaxID=195108 RepID=UPI0023019B56|nr:MFS domain-containing protein [Fusarium falciforme]WAO95106.1 MFS domain-containing protein [Fusarium falciforme]
MLGWRWPYKTCAIVLKILFVLFTFFYEETKYIPIPIGSTENASVNQDSLERLDKNSQPNAKATQSAADLEYNSFSATVPLPNSYRQRMRTGIQCANCVLFLVLLSTINSIAFSRPPYNFNTTKVGLMLLGSFVGNMIVSIYGGWLGDSLIVRLALRNGGIFEPEMRLYILGLPALSMGAELVVYGMTVDRGLQWIYPSIGGALFAC